MITPVSSYNPYQRTYNAPVVTGYTPPVNAYAQPDAYSKTYAQASPTGNPATPSYPVSSIIEDMTVSSRYSLFFINNTNRLLSLGTTWGGVGRFILNALAGNVPIFTSSDKSQLISSNVSRWVGRADLLRVGASPVHTVLFQDVGVMNMNDLSYITNPMDQGVLCQRLQMAGAARGIMDIPTIGMVQQWVQIAQTLPKKF